jgi:hypothetical protein
MDVHVPQAIPHQLRRRNVDVLTAQEDDVTEIEDPELLRRSTTLGRVLFTQDINPVILRKLSQCGAGLTVRNLVGEGGKTRVGPAGGQRLGEDGEAGAFHRGLGNEERRAPEVIGLGSRLDAHLDEGQLEHGGTGARTRPAFRSLTVGGAPPAFWRELTLPAASSSWDRAGAVR